MIREKLKVLENLIEKKVTGEVYCHCTDNNLFIDIRRETDQDVYIYYRALLPLCDVELDIRNKGVDIVIESIVAGYKRFIIDYYFKED